MTENETELIELIRNNENPEQALLIAIDIIIDFLNHHESVELKSSVEFQELV